MGTNTIFFKILFFISTFYLLYIFHQFNGANIYHPPITFRLLAVLNIFIVLLPLNTTLSLDKLFSTKPFRVAYVKKYNYLFLAFVVGIIYLDGAIYKSLDFYNWIVHSDIYFLKIYLGAIDYIRDNFIVDFILNHTLVAQIIVLSVYLYQLSFIFVVFFLTRIKIYFFIIGISLHLGMAIFFDFSFIVLFTLLFYIPLLPNRFYYKLFSFFRIKKKKNIKVVYDGSCMVCTKYIKLLKLFDFNNKIFLYPKNLQNESEIYIYINNKSYKGVDGFKNLFKETKLLYMFYLLLKVGVIYKLALYLYRKFSEKRVVFNCKLNGNYISENNYILGIYIFISLFGLLLVKFKFFVKVYLFYAIFFGIYPINVFIIRSDKAVYHTSFYFEDKFNKKVYINDYSKKSKYIKYYLNNNYKNINQKKYAKILKSNYLKICKERKKFLFKNIESLKSKKNLKNELDNYFLSTKIKLKCKDLG